MERAEAVLERYAKSGNPRLGASASFRGLNNASDELILGLDALARKYGTLLQTHACFSYSTHDSSVARTGKAEIERLEALGVIDERMLIVHSGWLEPEEVAILARRKPSLVCAPSSSLHNGYGNFLFGKLPELMALGVNVAIGSDHASSGIVDMPQEIRLACCCYKETRINPRVMPPETGLEMATRNGAKAALADDRIGSIEVGKDADIVLFDTDRPEWQPLINPVSNLVYSATGDSVRDVFVAGEHLVADGRLTKIDEDKLYERDSGRGRAFRQAPEARPDGAVALAGLVRGNGRKRESKRPKKKDGKTTPWRMCSASIGRRFPISRSPICSRSIGGAILTSSRSSISIRRPRSASARSSGRSPTSRPRSRTGRRQRQPRAAAVGRDARKAPDLARRPGGSARSSLRSTSSSTRR